MKQQQEKTKNKEKKTREIAARARKIKKDHEAQKAKEAAEEVARQQQHNERERKDRLLFGGSRADGCRAGKFSYHLFTYVFAVVLFQTKENIL